MHRGEDLNLNGCLFGPAQSVRYDHFSSESYLEVTSREQRDGEKMSCCLLFTYHVTDTVSFRFL